MTTLTALAPSPAFAPVSVAASPLLTIHRQLFPERYDDVALSHWTPETAAELSHLVAVLSDEDHDAATAAALADVAHQLADVDDLGPADALDAAVVVVEAACRRLLVVDVVAL